MCRCTGRRSLVNNGEWRIDVENPATGIRAGNVHLKIEGNKYFYNPETGLFYTRKADTDTYLPVSATKIKTFYV